MSIRTTATHNGVEYRAAYTTITSTALRNGEFGELTWTIHCEGASGSAELIGFGLEHPLSDETGTHHRCVPSAAGIALLKEVIRVAGVGTWEQLTGTRVILIKAGGSNLGFVNPDTEEVLIFGEFMVRYERELEALKSASTFN